jgi:hypothetical protein
MFEQNVSHVVLHLDEKEATQLAHAVQILVQELGFDPEEVDRYYKESLAFFLRNDHIDQRSRGDSHITVQMSTIA